MSSYIAIALYRNRTGHLMACAETSAGRGKPVALDAQEQRTARELVGAVAGVEGRRWFDVGVCDCGSNDSVNCDGECAVCAVRSRLMPRDELARGCCEVLAKLRGGCKQ